MRIQRIQKCVLFTVLTITHCLLFGEPTAISQETATEDQVIQRQRELMSESAVRVMKNGVAVRGAKMLEKPVLRYGDEPQKIGDSTVWAWMDEGRPVAIQKTEDNKYFKPHGWTYCFCALSEELVEVKWPNVGSAYRSTEPVKFHPIPNTPKSIASAKWPLQSRALAREFSATASHGKTTVEELRLVPNPYLTYESKTNGILTGSIYGLATGTNPSAFLIVELRESAGSQQWTYAFVQATSAALVLHHAGVEIQSAVSQGQPGHFPNWTYTWFGGE